MVTTARSVTAVTAQEDHIFARWEPDASETGDIMTQFESILLVLIMAVIFISVCCMIGVIVARLVIGILYLIGIFIGWVVGLRDNRS